MRITILAYGTRGDVQPYIALGVGLKRAGHAVRLAAPEPFEEFVGEHGLDFAPLAGDPANLSRDLVDRAGHNPIRAIGAMGSYVIPVALRVLAQAQDACRDADAIIHSFLMLNTGYEIARRRDVPDFFANPFPVFASTAAFTAAMYPHSQVGIYNHLTHDFSTWTFWNASRLIYGWLRRRHPELLPLSGWPFDSKNGPPTPILFGFSPLVIPKPADWGEDIHVTGYWFLDEGGLQTRPYKPPDDLAEFLEGGPPPVYIGFGSMVTAEAEKLTRIAVEGLAQASQRGVILGGWSGIGGGGGSPPFGDRRTAPTNDVLVIDSAPHDWLFPRMAAIVHHGGAGTTAAALRSGMPALVAPFTADQPFWGQRVYELGVGPKPIPRKKLTAERLAEAIRQMVSDQAMRDRAAALGERIRAEDGVGKAVEIIEQRLAL